MKHKNELYNLWYFSTCSCKTLMLDLNTLIPTTPNRKKHQQLVSFFFPPNSYMLKKKIYVEELNCIEWAVDKNKYSTNQQENYQKPNLSFSHLF